MHMLNRENYLKQVSYLSCLIDQEPHVLQKLLHLIEISKEQAGSSFSEEEFFKAEYAFYTEHYDLALKHYLEAKEIDHFEFFCYRATAYLLKEQGTFHKSLEFTRRAVEIIPNDYRSLKLLAHLLKQQDRGEESNEILVKMHQLEMVAKEVEPSDSMGSYENSLVIEKANIAVLTDGFMVDSVDCDCVSSTDRAMAMATSKECFPFGNGQQVEAKSSMRGHLLSCYLADWQNRKVIPDDCLCVFDGWHDGGNQRGEPSIEGSLLNSSKNLMLSMLYSGEYDSSGGFYFRWRGKGVAVNPGKNFMINFHHAGFHIKDIDHVIVTGEESSAFTDIRKIYDLSFRLNQEMAGSKHIIQYYLNQKVFQQLAGILKPHSKEERHSVHMMELFADLPEGDKIDLTNSIQLHYFSLDRANSGESISSFATKSREINSIGVYFELKKDEGMETQEEGLEKSIHIGYIPSLTKDAFTHQQVKHCEVLITKVHHGDHVKECDAIKSFIEKFDSRLVVATGFDAYEGDVRLESVRKIRQAIAFSQKTTVLPADTGLFIDLTSLRIKCTFTHTLIDPNNIRVIHSTGPFSRLQYITPACCL